MAADGLANHEITADGKGDDSEILFSPQTIDQHI